MAISKITNGGVANSGLPSGGLVLLDTKTVASASAGTTSLQLNNVFSADYQNYRVNFDIVIVADAGRSTHTAMYIGFGNSGTIRTSGDAWAGACWYYQSNTAASGSFSGQATDSCLLGGTGTVAELQFIGFSIINNPFSSSLPHEVKSDFLMSYTGLAANQYEEHSFGVTTAANFSTTDINFQGVTGVDTTTSNDVSALTKTNVYGTFKVYGIKDSF